jgi:hypothetical protein
MLSSIFVEIFIVLLESIFPTELDKFSVTCDKPYLLGAARRSRYKESNGCRDLSYSTLKCLCRKCKCHIGNLIPNINNNQITISNMLDDKFVLGVSTVRNIQLKSHVTNLNYQSFMLVTKLL